MSSKKTSQGTLYYQHRSFLSFISSTPFEISKESFQSTVQHSTILYMHSIIRPARIQHRTARPSSSYQGANMWLAHYDAVCPHCSPTSHCDSRMGGRKISMGLPIVRPTHSRFGLNLAWPVISLVPKGGHGAAWLAWAWQVVVGASGITAFCRWLPPCSGGFV